MINKFIHASEAYTDKGALNTLLTNKRDIAVLSPSNLEIVQYYKRIFSLNNLEYKIVLKPTNPKQSLWVVYRDKNRANDIIEYMNNHDGYLSDRTPEEAWYVGKLLQYNESSIIDYIEKNYHIKYNPNIRNFDTLDEAVSIMNVKDLPFYQEVVDNGGKIYQVGGAVRDSFLNKESKDLDIVISNIEPSKLENMLKKYGKVDMVGASFGVIKFTPPNGDEIDIAFPRRERKLGTGYKGFEVTADHTLPIEKDLERRDFTMNSIAKDSDDKLIDPFGGVSDIANKVIRLTNPVAFSEDPLRMLRAIQFSSRFNFTIDPQTYKAIKDNADKISEITKERILIEFEKIVSKGDPKIGAELLIDSGLYRNIFGVNFDGNIDAFEYVKRLSEFIYWLIEPLTDQPDLYYKQILKGDEETAKEISALAYLYENVKDKDLSLTEKRWIYFNIYKISKQMINSPYVYAYIEDVYGGFNDGQYPKTVKELNINGNDIMRLGLSGPAIGKVINKILNGIYSDEITNNKKEIIQYISEIKNTLNESVIKEKEAIFMDFDGTLIDSPLKEEGMLKWSKKYQIPYPHKGWWGRPESLDLNVFDIKPIPQMKKIYDKYVNDSNCILVLITNRQPKLKEQVLEVLNRNNITFDDYIFSDGKTGKGSRILKLLTEKYPDIKKITFYDDDIKNIESVNNELIDTDIYFETHLV